MRYLRCTDAIGGSSSAGARPNMVEEAHGSAFQRVTASTPARRTSRSAPVVVPTSPRTTMQRHRLRGAISSSAHARRYGQVIAADGRLHVFGQYGAPRPSSFSLRSTAGGNFSPRVTPSDQEMTRRPVRHRWLHKGPAQPSGRGPLDVVTATKAVAGSSNDPTVEDSPAVVTPATSTAGPALQRQELADPR